MVQTVGVAMYNVPAEKVDFISTQMEVLIGKHCGYFRVELLQEIPCGVQGWVDGTVSPVDGTQLSCSNYTLFSIQIYICTCLDFSS